MQLIVNCLIPYHNGFVMLQKPRRGWWVLPGGKVESGELWHTAAKREAQEETGLLIGSVRLRGIYTLDIYGEDGTRSLQRLIAQFVAEDVRGLLLPEMREGKLAVKTPLDLDILPMDGGDRMMVKHTISAEERQSGTIFFGKFTYNSEHVVMDFQIEATQGQTMASAL
jgi:8-oxo-dGTP diphosphatase